MTDQQQPPEEKKLSLKEWVLTKLPALIMAFLEAVYGRINQLKNQNDKKQLELDKRDAHDKIDADAAARGSNDILDDAIRSGGGDPGPSSKNSNSGSN